MTTYSPSEIIFGHKVRLPMDVELQNPFSSENTPKDYIKYMIRRYQIIHNEANIRQKHYDKLRKKSYDKIEMIQHTKLVIMYYKI